MTEVTTVRGGCHCGAVQFEAKLQHPCEAQICNCSICRKCGFQHLIVPATQFQLTSGTEFLRNYQFRSKTAKHFFCCVCGVKSFYVPRSNPDGYSLNVRCLDLPADCEVEFSKFDGRNWSKHGADLAHLSTERAEE